jgi:hypothetical protein
MGAKEINFISPLNKMATVKTIFMVGIITLSMLSILGLIYLTKMSFCDKKVTKTEKGIARLTTVLLWIQIGWIVLGAILQTVLFNGVFTDD